MHCLYRGSKHGSVGAAQSACVRAQKISSAPRDFKRQLTPPIVMRYPVFSHLNIVAVVRANRKIPRFPAHLVDLCVGSHRFLKQCQRIEASNIDPVLIRQVDPHLFHEYFHIFANVTFGTFVAKQISRVIGRHQFRPTPLMKTASKPA